MRVFVFNVLILVLFSSCLKRQEIVEPSQFEIDYCDKLELADAINSDFFKKLENFKSDSLIYQDLQYLFTYMPLSDFADYDFEFFLNQVKYAHLTKETFPWAKNIPQDIFRHYVLPARVNNENLDTARMVFYRELSDRLLDLDLNIEEATLEINHWCHEKVIYKGSDERTISPLGAVRSGFGRCGEESTFTVTALRAAGIPARQVYTPRWAHTDDNHAWVEVWIEGEWKYLGACEPLPRLNMGWFTVPASRAMLVHTKQFGENNVDNPNYLANNANYTWINALKTYSPTKDLIIIVLNKNNMPVWGADVKFQLYNYAEMYPLHSTKTDINGIAKFTTGYGSLEVSVSFKGKTLSKTINPEDKNIIKLQLDKDSEFPLENVVYYPPIAGEEPIIDPKEEELNKERLKQEDKIRANNEALYYDEDKAKQFIKTFDYQEIVMDFLIGSRGNWNEIEAFLIEASYKNYKNEAINLLLELSEKDWRDSKREILSEHCEYAIKHKNKDLNDSIFYKYVLNPRINFELLTNYRSVILESLTNQNIEDFKSNPEKISQYINNNIKTQFQFKDKNVDVQGFNNYFVSITPIGVNKIKYADPLSLKIYTVAFCRSLGIPARINLATNFAQYFHNEKWIDFNFNENADINKLNKANLYFTNLDTTRDLKYRIHFSIARLEKGFFNTIDLGWETPISKLSNGIELLEGKYMLLTAHRNSDESISVKRKYFDLKAKETKTIDISMPEDNNILLGISAFNHGNLSNKQGNYISSNSICKMNTATAFCWINPSQEPSKHIIRDVYASLNELTNNNINIVFITEKESFKPEDYGFSKDITSYFDKDLNLLNKNSSCRTSRNNNIFPNIMLIYDGNCIFSSKGYIINLGDILINEWKKYKLNYS
ncbi:MAG: transglutaminase-like domain-containing protein [Bacteroidales bacterium]|nr:transglutaminase-like domain-containing protein [Bacteroidales bacterium]MCK9498684.1 transglutaminase-like domain-containing protein [Bacteroidales bacterium]